tara:strand:- start:266 stop:697 length:432 start_codon:yes stop_codon:yes gene_type:complete
MADKKISQLNSVTTPLDGTEQIPIVQGGETKKVNSSEFISDFDNRATTIQVQGTYNVEWSAFSVRDITLLGNTILTQSNLPSSGGEKTIILYVIGDYSLTLPTTWQIKNGGTYDGVNGSQIVVQSWDNQSLNPNFYTVINNEQ